MALKALIFDFDGVILDSETPEYQIWQTICGRYGINIPLPDWEIGMGSSLEAFDPVVYLELRLGCPVDRQALKQEHHQILVDRLNHQPPLPGIAETIRLASNEGVLLAVASSSSMNWIETNLDRLGLLKYFDVLCTSNDVQQVKPHPALYQLALQRLGVPSHQAVAVEDSPNGIRAACAAGIFCIAVPTSISACLDLTQANLILPSFDQISLQDLMNLVE